MGASGSGGVAGGASQPENPELTFRPKTNKVRRDMVSAQRYLQQSWVDRLSKPHPSQVQGGDGDSDDDDDDDDDDDGSYYSDSGADKENDLLRSGRGSSRGGSRSGSRNSRRQSSTPMPYTRKTKKRSSRPSSAPPRQRKADQITNREKRESFQNFIQKQKTRSEQQKKRLEKSRINNTCVSEWAGACVR